MSCRLAGVGARHRARRVRRAGSAAALEPPGAGRRAGAHRSGRGGGDRYGVGEVAGLPAAGAVGLRRRPAGDRAVPLAHQGAGRRPAAGARRARARGRAGRALRRRHPARRARLGPPARPVAVQQPGHAAPLAAAAARPLGRATCAACATWCSTSATPTAGVFGSHVALLLRRLLRVCARYGARPTIVLASATVADPAAFAARLTGRDVVAVTDDGSPAAGRTVALWEPPLLDELTGENGAPVRRSAGAESAPDAGRPRGRGRPHAGLRPLAAGCGADGARRPAGARRGGPRAGAAGVGLPRRLPAGGAAGAGGRAGPRRAARGRHHERAGARRRHRRAGRRGRGGLSRHPGLVLAAGRPGRAWPRRGAGGAGGPRRPARHLPGPPSRRPARGTGGGLRARPRQPVRAGPAPGLRRRRAAADARRTWARSAARRRRRCWPSWWRTGCCAAGPEAGSGRRRRTGPPARWTCAGPGRARWPWSRSTPAGCWAPSRARPRRRACIRARSTCTRARATSSTTWTWTPGSPWCTPPRRTGAPTPGRRRTSPWCGSPSTATTARCGCRSARSP